MVSAPIYPMPMLHSWDLFYFLFYPATRGNIVVISRKRGAGRTLACRIRPMSAEVSVAGRGVAARRQVAVDTKFGGGSTYAEAHRLT